MYKPLLACLLFFNLLFVACEDHNQVISASLIKEIKLKKGAIISCSPGESLLGNLSFETSCKAETEDFNTGIKFLHSFEYDEAEKMFARVIEKEPACAMAYWGVAMSNFQQLWRPATPSELLKGCKAIEIARSIKNKTNRESDYIEAIAAYYRDGQKKIMVQGQQHLKRLCSVCTHNTPKIKKQLYFML